MLYVSVEDNLILENRALPIGTQLTHTSSTGGDIYPYYLVLRDGQLQYYPEGINASIYPGDKVIAPTSVESDFPVFLLEDTLIEQVITPLLDLNRNLGEFVLGAVYQYMYDQGDFPRQLLSVSPEVRQWFEATEQEAEQALLDTAAFQAGRLFGDGAAVVTGVLEILGGFGLGATGGAAGASLCLTGVGCIAGAPAIAVSVVGGAVIIVDGANTIRVGLENILEQIEGTIFAAISGQGGLSQPKPGDPVQGLSGVTYRRSANYSRNQADVDYEIRATGKGQQNRDLAVENPNVIPSGRTKPVEFDWFDSATGKLLDAKNASEVGRYDVRRTDNMMENVFKPDILREARAQVESLRGSGATEVEWRVASREVADALQEFFADNNINIIVRYFPFQ